MSAVKDEAKRLIDLLPDNATWDDPVYEFYVRKKIEEGLKDAEEGRTIHHEDVKKVILKMIVIAWTIALRQFLEGMQSKIQVASMSVIETPGG